MRLIGHGDGRRWLLKNPTDLYSMQELLAVFPDAMVVQTHRDPVAAIPSIASLIFASRKVFGGSAARPEQVGRREAGFWRDALVRCERARAQAPDQFFDVEFASFVTDQMAAIRAIYQHFALRLTSEIEAAMQSWLAAHPRRSTPGRRYAPEAWGLTAAGLADIFAEYRAQRGYDRS